MKVQGLSKDDILVEANEHGASQSYIDVRFDLIDPLCLINLAQILNQGAIKYGDNNWKLLDKDSIYNHIMLHLNAYKMGDTSDDHLGHAFCRVMMLLSLELNEPNKPSSLPVSDLK